MPTVDKPIADRIVAGNGIYPGDEGSPVHSIVKYKNAWGGESYGLNYSRHNAYTASEYVHAPELYWSAGDNAVQAPDTDD